MTSAPRRHRCDRRLRCHRYTPNENLCQPLAAYQQRNTIAMRHCQRRIDAALLATPGFMRHCSSTPRGISMTATNQRRFVFAACVACLGRFLKSWQRLGVNSNTSNDIHAASLASLLCFAQLPCCNAVLLLCVENGRLNKRRVRRQATHRNAASPTALMTHQRSEANAVTTPNDAAMKQ